MTRRTIQLAIALIGSTIALHGGTALAVTGDAGTVPPPSDPISVASFEGGWIDLTEGWGEATACHAAETATRCYRTKAEMDAAEQIGPPASAFRSAARAGARAAHALATCSTSLRLYRSTSYTGGVLAISIRATVVNLSALGFDNDTSSYQVGACSATFWESANAGGSTYPGSTSAGASSPSMWVGWDNRVSSVYLA